MSRFLVTGASGSIGRAIGDALVADAHTVVGTDLHPGPHVSPRAIADLTNAAQRRDVLDGVIVAGTIDGVVFAHGVEGTGGVDSLDEQRLRRVMAINFTSVVGTFTDVAPHISADGVAVFIASQAGLRGEVASAAYCASKFALVGWFRHLDQPRPAPRLRLVSPGAIDSDLVRDAFAGMARTAGTSPADIERERIQAIPAGRLGRPDEVAAAVIYAIGTTIRRLELSPTGGETLS